MARLAIICLALIIQLGVANASTYQTILTTNPTQRCQRELQGVEMNWCYHYLLKYIRLATKELERRCCAQLGKVNPECRCDAIKQTLEEAVSGIASSEGQTKQQTMQEMVRDARQMPRMCRLMEPEYCNVSVKQM
ncbi:hypothetical protein ACHQM5_003190 [Ranunculus cassubicifolius]